WRAAHWPAAIALIILAAVSVARGPLLAALHPMPKHVEGPALILVYADRWTELATLATVAGLCVAVAVSQEYRRRALLLNVAGWALACIALSALYPPTFAYASRLQRFYFAADLVGLFVSAVALVIWAQRGMAAKRSPDSSSMVALCLFLLDGAILLAPFS